MGRRTLDELAMLFGKAFLVAVERRDRDNAVLFARALLTRLPRTQPR